MPKQTKQGNKRNNTKKPRTRRDQGGAGESKFSSVRAAAAIGTCFTLGRPSIERRSQGMRVRHTEVYTTVESDPTTIGQFHISSPVLNPGSAAVFPWLSTVAKDFEFYVFHRLHAFFVPRVATSVQGAIQLAPEYDVRDPIPATSMTVVSMEGAAEGPVWRHLEVEFLKRRMFATNPKRKVGTGLNPDTAAARLLISTEGGAEKSQVYGRIYFEYDIELFSPAAVPGPYAVTPPLVNTMFVNANPVPMTTQLAYDLVPHSGMAFNALSIGANGAEILLPRGTFLIHATCEVYCVAKPYTVGGNLEDHIISYLQLVHGSTRVGHCYSSAVLANEADTILNLAFDAPFVCTSDNTALEFNVKNTLRLTNGNIMPVITADFWTLTITRA